MTSIAFIGLGNMGAPMARNLIKAGHDLRVFDLSQDAMLRLTAAGAAGASSPADAASAAEIVITMLPAGAQTREVYLGEGGVISAVSPGTLLIDCSTIDVATARAVNAEAEAAGLDMIDAPVSGGVGGAEAVTLTFMVGGSERAFERARPILEAMGKAVVHAGGAGNGQAAKICNNMILGISMIAVSEAFALAERLGLAHQTLFDISSKASGQCWSLTSYCPVPGPVPASPANRNYAPGFTVAMMLKDLKLSQEAASQSGAATPLGGGAADLYARFAADGNEALDFSAIYTFLKARGQPG
jgi:3-hydroxyisobutyrate dehydrogenase